MKGTAEARVIVTGDRSDGEEEILEPLLYRHLAP